MKIEPQQSDESILAELGVRIARQRLDRNLTQAQLGDEAGVSRRTIERVEAGESAQLSNVIRILRALGVVEHLELLLPEASVSPVALLALRGRQRKRASTRKGKGEPAPTEWTWGDDS